MCFRLQRLQCLVGSSCQSDSTLSLSAPGLFVSRPEMRAAVNRMSSCALCSSSWPLAAQRNSSLVIARCLLTQNHVLSPPQGTEVCLRRSALNVCPYGDPWGTTLHLETRHPWAPVKTPRGTDTKTASATGHFRAYPISDTPASKSELSSLV